MSLRQVKKVWFFIMRGDIRWLITRHSNEGLFLAGLAFLYVESKANQFLQAT